MTAAFDGHRVVVIGLGVSGRAAAEALAAEGAEVWVSEARPPDEIAPWPDGAGVDVRAGGHRPEHLDGATLAVVSPGVPEHAPVIRWALERGLPVWSELEVGARLCRVPYVAVTGTNGKTTTTEMVAEMMTQAGLRARACGNVGYPFATAARQSFDALAVEASSFQLRFTETLHPRVSVLVNLSPDHLDWHGSMAAYAEAKARVFGSQRAGDVHIGNADDPEARAISAEAPCEVRWFREGPPEPGQIGVEGGAVVARNGTRRELGAPRGGSRAFLIDAAAASAASLAFGLGAEPVGRALAAASPGPHRGQEVARLGSVVFVDDSQATNPQAALASLIGRTDVVLIAGGVAKGLDLSPLRAAAPSLAAVVAIGEAAEALRSVFADAAPVHVATTMEEAVAAAADLVPPDGIVLLAPACASFDMFRDYRERGDRFAAAARAVVEKRRRRVRREDTHA
ncbi:MAG: UDP-N-acetylmuramoyl-L-alanine--D-glutamate ligase [Actinomycetota bacterium]